MAHGCADEGRSRRRRTALLLVGATAVGGLGLQVTPAAAAPAAPAQRVIVVLEDDRMSAAGVRAAAMRVVSWWACARSVRPRAGSRSGPKRNCTPVRLSAHSGRPR